ncbi:CENP-Q, a CENPA-CAD centromere complex subunit-domain-containing protein [Jackrogersella minutella]|nr:CENP-Q, a CENPA-CAD centromere complex subunit-domain-containing protein [Jackrogersella minutella]
MATETANQKRKRGRPTNASRNDGDASRTQPSLTIQAELATTSENIRGSDMDESSRPRKRGRPANTEAARPEPETAQPQRAKRGRGPSTALQSNNGREDAGKKETKATNTKRRKPGRPRLSVTNGEVEVEEHNNSNAASENAPPKKRGRPPKKVAQANEPEADEADDENEDNSSLLRRSGRARQSSGLWPKTNQDTTEPADEQPSNNQKPKGHKKRGRPSLTERHVEEAEQESGPRPKKKRGRPSLNKQPPAEAEANPASQDRPKKRGRPPLSGGNASASTKEKGKKPRTQPPQDREDSAQEEEHPGGGRPRQSNNQSRPEQRRHRRSSETQDRSSDSGASPPSRYRHLTTRTRRVPRNVVESKWTALEAPAINSITTLLQSASRPVLLRLSNAQRHAHAAAALTAVSNRLRSKISRGLPFPPATTSARREEEFEFERAISGVQALESQLDPLLHAVELLRREKDRAQRDLDAEYKVLGRLGANARAEARERRERTRKMHVLVPEEMPPGSKLDGEGDGEQNGNVFADLRDEELLGLAGQIASHMESMRGNLQQVDGVVPAIARSRGALRAALQSRLDREMLENVVLG